MPRFYKLKGAWEETFWQVKLYTVAFLSQRPGRAEHFRDAVAHGSVTNCHRLTGLPC